MELKKTKTLPSVLCIAGMHRSGTSMTSNWLNTSGLHIGTNLFGATYGNPLGHFEDFDFVSLQEEILRYNGILFKISNQKLEVPEHLKNKAEELVRSRNYLNQWGWKDPRTCLFLPMWKSLIPNMKVLAVFRPWREVVSSIIRRNLRQDCHSLKKALLPYWHNPKNILITNGYLKTWIRYNNDILSFKKSNPEDVILISLSNLIENSENVADYIGNHWRFSLKPVPIKEIHNHSLLKRKDIMGERLKVNSSNADKADILWRDLSHFDDSFRSIQ